MNLTLTAEQRRTIDEHPGEPVVVTDPDRRENFVLVRAEDYERIRHLLAGVAPEGAWTDEKEARRLDLIDRELLGTITTAEQAELLTLQEQANAHFDEVAPPPLEGAERLLRELTGKRDGQK